MWLTSEFGELINADKIIKFYCFEVPELKKFTVSAMIHAPTVDGKLFPDQHIKAFDTKEEAIEFLNKLKFFLNEGYFFNKEA